MKTTDYAITWARAWQLEADLRPDILGVAIYCDRVQLLLPRWLGTEEIRALEPLCGSVNQHAAQYQGSNGEIYPAYWARHRGRDVPYFAVLQLLQPTTTALNYLMGLFSDPDLPKINGAEFALDLLTGNPQDAPRLAIIISKQWLKPWHKQEHHTTQYAHATTYIGNRKGRIQHVVYSDLPSKVSGTSCVHLELRLQGLTMMRAQGLATLREFLAFDQRTIWRKRLTLAVLDLEKLGKWLGKRHGNSTAALTYIVHRPRNTFEWTALIYLRTKGIVPPFPHVSVLIAELRSFGVSNAVRFAKKRQLLDSASLPTQLWGARG